MKQKNLSRILIGVFLVAIGIGLLGNTFNLWDFNLFFDGFWTLFLIVPAIVSMINGGFSTGNVILFLIGALLLLKEQGVLPNIFSFQFVIAIILIIIGGGYLIGKSGRHNNPQGNLSPEDKDNFEYPDYFVLFGSSVMKNTSRDLKCGRFTAIFGGLEIDLSDAVLRNDVTLTASALFGGIDIKPPRNALVRASGVPIFGGFESKLSDPPATGEPQYILHLNYTAIFGGVETK